jgi:hypothetical protein
MRKSRFTEEQITGVLREQEAGGNDLSPNFPPVKSRVRGCRQAHPAGVFLFG